MKKKELIEIIQFAVRTELKKTIPLIIKECTQNITESTIVKKETSVRDPFALAKDVLKKEQYAPKKAKTKINYSKNAAINEILNNTVGGIPQEGSLVGGYDTKQPQMTDLQGNVVNLEELPDSLNNALTKNYSELLTAIDEKKGNKK